MVARLTPDQKVGGSIPFGVILQHASDFLRLFFGLVPLKKNFLRAFCGFCLDLAHAWSLCLGVAFCILLRVRRLQST